MKAKITEFSHDLPLTDDFKSIVLNQNPLIDVRAPVEFQQGAFEMSSNLPLMTDEERHKVGICYKEHGNATAVRLGHQLVNEQVRAPRVQAWQDFVQQHSDALLYCFRGGQRSKISQQWLAEQGVEITRLKGGYKAFRRYLIDYLDAVPVLMTEKAIQSVVVAGRTGCGKTLVINQLNNSIDLEGLAHHRGSAFGRHATPQPTQINFENNLAMAMIRLFEKNPKQMVIEDEGRNIGSVNLPVELFDYLKNDQRVLVETSIEERVAITLDEYVVEAQQEYAVQNGADNALQAWVDFMLAAFGRIQKRLGGERHQRVMKLFETAVSHQQQTGSVESHQAWIETLLTEYYDPMYDYQMQKHHRKVNFQGTQQEVIDYLQSQAQ